MSKKMHNLQEEYDRLCAELNQQWEKAGDIEHTFADKFRVKIESQGPRAWARNERMLQPKLIRCEEEHTTRLAALMSGKETREKQSTDVQRASLAALDVEETARWQALEADWNSKSLRSIGRRRP